MRATTRALLAFVLTIVLSACGETGGGPAGELDAQVAADASNEGDAGTPIDAAITLDAGRPDGSIEEPSIPSNFETSEWLVPSWGTGAIPDSAEPDVVGAFRFICNASHLSYDDPIVYPGEPGRAHLHQFFGNTLADAHSTYESLRTTGESTCNNALNRSAYWIPAMMNGRGQVVRPDHVSVYYKRYPVTSPLCAQQGLECRNIPRGLRFVFGYDAASPDGPGHGYFNCDGPTATPGHYDDIATAAANCPPGNRLGAVISAPDCWNGRDLDSPDHRSHMAHASYGDWGYLRCPDTHPYVIPTFTLGVWYTTDDDLDRTGSTDTSIATWHLSSDETTTGRVVAGTTLHADWWGAWDDDVLDTWQEHCIDRLLNCSGGDLGNGQQLRMYDGFSWTADPRVVDPPPRPDHSGH